VIMSEMPAERDRVVLTRFYLQEDDKDVICRDLGLSPLHFDKVIFRARKRMKELLESHGFKKTDFLGLALLACA
jgi:RNA polymerase sigma-70 factor (ECF subfamily)